VSGRLPCGRDLDHLVEQVFDGVAPREPEHQAQCPHCQAALQRLRAARDGLGAVRAEPVVAPRALVGDVLARVRAAGTHVTVDAGAGGSTRSSADVVSSVAQRAAAGVDGVAYASAVVTEALETGVVALRVRLVVGYGPSALKLAAEVRSAVERDVERLTGATLRAVDVVIDDVAP
jgi:hypothetical protein